MMARCVSSGYSRCPNDATWRIKGWGRGFSFCNDHITGVVKTLRVGWDLVEEIPQQGKTKKIYPTAKSNKQAKNMHRNAG